MTGIERSAGVIPFRRVNGRVNFYYCIVVWFETRTRPGSFQRVVLKTVKTEHQAALREIFEETGMKAVSLLPDFRDQVEYHYRRQGRPIDKTSFSSLAR